MLRIQIKTIVLAGICLSLATVLFAQTEESKKLFNIESANRAVAEFKSGVKEIQAKYEAQYLELEAGYAKALQSVYETYLKNLEKARMEAMGEDELEEAVRIRDMIKRIESMPPPKHPFEGFAGGVGEPPKDAVTFKDSRYKLIEDPLPVTEAVRACQKMGGHLVRIDNDEENSFVAGLLLNAGEKRAWIDGSDAASEGDWILSDDEKMKYFNWKTKMLGDEPNNGGKSEHWIQIDKEGKWYDENAGSRVVYVCEWDY